MEKAKNCLLLDLDGTVRESVSGVIFINQPTDQRVIDGAAEAAIAWQRQGWAIYGVTNQKGVLAEHKTLESMIAEQRRTIELMPCIDAIFACPDEGNTCYFITLKEQIAVQRMGLNAVWQGLFRKPNAGMLMAAVNYHAYWFNPDYQAVMVGDRPEDKQAAENAGVRFLSAEDWRAGIWPEL